MEQIRKTEIVLGGHLMLCDPKDAVTGSPEDGNEKEVARAVLASH